jgi:hypothetical protein
MEFATGGLCGPCVKTMRELVVDTLAGEDLADAMAIDDGRAPTRATPYPWCRYPADCRIPGRCVARINCGD